MRALVKAAALSSVIVLANVQPGADAARGPDWSEGAHLSVPAAQVAEVAADEIGLAPLQRPDNILSNAAAIEFPKAAALDASTWGIAIPAPADLSLALYGIGPAIESAEPKAADATKADPLGPAVAVAPVEKQIAPEIDIPLPAVRPQLKTLRQAARIEQIKFESPTVAPFAHVRFCLSNPADCRERKLVFRGGPMKLTEAKRRELMNVNTRVNRDIIATRMDEPVAQEKWQISPEFGDCNDYAVTKRHKLLAKGWPARALLLAEVVVPSGEHHLVVVVRTDKGDLVLDNLNANLRSPAKTGYQWVRVESPLNPKYWSKVAAPATEMAAVERRHASRL